MLKNPVRYFVAVALMTCLIVAVAPTGAFAARPGQNETKPEPKPPADDSGAGDQPAKDTDADAPAKKRVEYGPTEIGVRMTPAIAAAMSHRMSEQMQQRYGLDDKQVEKISDTMQYHILKLAHENAEAGRDVFESMMAAMIANNGGFSRDQAVDFGKQIKPLIPALRQFFLDSSVDIGKDMTLKQRLKYTGDMTALTAGLGVFEERMNHWAAGEVKDGANPFFDRPVTSDDDDEPVEGESKEARRLRRTRSEVERTMAWQVNVESRWEDYVRNAIVFYNFDEEQQTSARGILEECKARAAKVKTDDWLKAYRDNRVAARLSWRLDSKFNNGPFRFQLDRAHDKLMKPLEDIGEELKRRIETLPTTKQRHEARKETERVLAEQGLDKVPL